MGMVISTQTHTGEGITPPRSPHAAAHRKVPRSGRTARAVRAPRPRKAAPVAFKTSSTLNDAIATVMTSCRDHWQVNLPAALNGRHPEGVHQVRVGLRRFRSALTLFRKFIPENQREWLNLEAKWLANQLGPVRDLDVFLTGLGGANSALTTAVRSAHTKAQSAADAALRGQRVRRFMTRLDAWVDGRGWYADDAEMPQVGAFAREALNKRLRKIRDVAARADELTVDERHELRIAVKKLRYSLEFLSPVLPARKVERTGAVLKRLQDSLGHLNDLDVAERTIALAATTASPVERRRIRKAGAALKAAHKKAAARAEPETARLCRKFVRLPAF
jgi:triphosphatase